MARNVHLSAYSWIEIFLYNYEKCNKFRISLKDIPVVDVQMTQQIIAFVLSVDRTWRTWATENLVIQLLFYSFSIESHIVILFVHWNQL